MHRLTIILALASAGCIAATDSDDGAEAASVASALTDNVQFEGGTVIDSPLPATSDDTVTITPLDETIIVSPGTSSIMALEVVHAEEEADPITATLVQFAGESRHIQVTARMKTPDAQGRVRIDNPFEVGADVCDKLCNTTHSATVTESTLLESGEVGATSTRTIDLDCNDSGDASFCGDIVEGDRPGPITSMPEQDASVDLGEQQAVITATQVQRFIDQQRGFILSECSCDGTCPDGIVPEATEGMLVDVQGCLEDMSVPDVGWLDCQLDLADEEIACEEAAMCDSLALDDCNNSFNGDTTCGLIPAEIDDALMACGYNTSGDTAPAPALDGWMCDDSTTISSPQVCDGTPDCPDASDEASCGGIARDAQFGCNDVEGTTVDVSLLCDGTADCPGGVDELPCQGNLYLCQEPAETVTVDLVCDGKADCMDGSDEVSCPDLGV